MLMKAAFPPKRKGGADDLQGEGEVLQREDRNGGADGEEEAQEAGDEEGESTGTQAGLLLRLSCRREKIRGGGLCG